jgi:hypothetical protein
MDKQIVEMFIETEVTVESMKALIKEKFDFSIINQTIKSYDGTLLKEGDTIINFSDDVEYHYCVNLENCKAVNVKGPDNTEKTIFIQDP